MRNTYYYCEHKKVVFNNLSKIQSTDTCHDQLRNYTHNAYGQQTPCNCLISVSAFHSFRVIGNVMRKDITNS